ncbi:MAG TPA: hypothetical protein VF898_11880 [Chloroflexota bacterium]
MSRRLIITLAAVSVASALPTAALASSHVVAQVSTKLYQGTVYLSRSLSSGHSYRIDISAPGRKPFIGGGVEHYIGVARGRLTDGNKSFNLKASTPYSYTVRPPSSAHLSEWILAVDVQVRSGSHLTVKLVDLGKTK